MNQDELNKALELHKLYLACDPTGERIDLTHADFSKADLENANLDFSILKKADLERANMENASLYYADLQKASLESADMTNADLKNANLEGANLFSAFLKNADLQDANLERSNLFAAILEKANLQRSILRFSCLENTSLSKANLGGAILYHATLQDANLQYALMQGTNLYAANLRGANLRGADLQGANLIGADLREANLIGANLEGTKLSAAALQGAKLWTAKNIPYDIWPLVCPDEGSFIGYTVGENSITIDDDYELISRCVIKLQITEDAKRCSATKRLCKASKAKVLSIERGDGLESFDSATPFYTEKEYHVGEIVEVADFDEKRWSEKSNGIFFFITRQEAAQLYSPRKIPQEQNWIY